MNIVRNTSARLAAGLGATAVVALLLAGCATPTAGPGATAPAATTPPAASPAPTEEPTAEPTAEPTTEPTPAEAPADPSDVSTWAISENAIGPFALGMSWDDAFAKAGELGWDLEFGTEDPASGCALSVNGPATSDVKIYVWGDANKVLDLVVTDNADGDAEGARPATAEGMTVGSAVEEVRAAYPGAMEDTVPIATDRFFLHVDADKDGNGISFEYREGQTLINSVSVNALGSPAYEHC